MTTDTATTDKSTDINFIVDKYGSNWTQSSILGYGPQEKQSSTREVRRKDGDIIYDVIYTTDDKGRRITKDNSKTADTLVLLFGCSFTIGEGVNDHDTFAWKLSEMLGDTFQVYNYGFHGYGSHQMLSLLESGLLDSTVKQFKNIYAFYLTINGHEYRSAGSSPWDMYGPRYILEGNSIVRDGTFNTVFRNLIKNSKTLKYVYEIYNSTQLKYNNKHITELHVAIIEKSYKIIQEKFEGKFCIFLYPGAEKFGPIIRAHNIPYVTISEKTLQFGIKGDGHPNNEAHTIIAEDYYMYILNP